VEADRVKAPQGAQHFVYLPKAWTEDPKGAYAMTLHQVDGRWYVNFWEKQGAEGWLKIMREEVVRSQELSLVPFQGIITGIAFSDRLYVKERTDPDFRLGVSLLKAILSAARSLEDTDRRNQEFGYTLD
jgi:hypothetical protein